MVVDQKAKPDAEETKRQRSPSKSPVKAAAAKGKGVAKKPAAGKKQAAEGKAPRGKAAKAEPKESKTSSSARRSKSVGAANSSKVESDDKFIYAEGSYVTFINGKEKADETRHDRFCIGQVSHALTRISAQTGQNCKVEFYRSQIYLQLAGNILC